MTKMKIILLAAVASMNVLLGSDEIKLESFKSLKPLDSKAFKLLDVKKVGDNYMLTANMNYQGRSKMIDLFVTGDKKMVVFGQAFSASTGKQIYSKMRADAQKKALTPTPYTYDMTVFDKLTPFSLGDGKDDYYLFTDFDCPFCKQLEQKLGKIKKEITLRILPFPLEGLHPYSKPKALKFMEMSTDKQVELVKLHKLSEIKFKEYTPRESTKKQLKAISDEFQKLGQVIKEHTPTFRGLGTPTLINNSGKKVDINILFEK